MMTLPQAHAVDCSRAAGSLPEALDIPIEHIVVIMQENHSFDSYFGRLNAQGYSKTEVDGVSTAFSNPTPHALPVHMYHADKLCLADTDHTWNAMHAGWDGGKLDGFVRANGKRAMAYYEQGDLPYYYALANQYAIADRYFASIMTQTYPNRMYLFAATSFGHIHNDDPKVPGEFSQKTIFDELDKHEISWRYYHVKEDYVRFFGPLHERDQASIVPVEKFKEDLEQNQLPQLSFVESSEDKFQDEHPPGNIQIGQEWVADKINALMKSPYWPKSVVFFTLDEAGGFYDHVAPPAACAPDGIAPKLDALDVPGTFARYGFRVPFIAISPYAKSHFVSHKTYDHTSILKFIETKFNLPALTRRDANADGLLELFDFAHPNPERGALPVATIDPKRARVCPSPK